MPPLDEYPVNPQQLERGVQALYKRQRNLMLMGSVSSIVLIASIIGLFVQQDFVYSFFGLSMDVQQLHIPSSVNPEVLSLDADQPDYFYSLLSWFGWLFLKLFAAFWGAFIFVYILKKIPFFYARFQSFILKFVGWLASFLMIWSGLTYVQYERNQEQWGEYRQIVHYEQNIQDSALAKRLKQAGEPAAVQAYLLAQAALLHQPADRAAAIPQVQSLIKAENNDPKFLEYGLKPEQLWVMQHQLFNKTMTPLAESISKQAAQAELLNTAVRWLLLGVIALTALLAAVLLTLSSRLKNRALRIEQRIH